MLIKIFFAAAITRRTISSFTSDKSAYHFLRISIPEQCLSIGRISHYESLYIKFLKGLGFNHVAVTGNQSASSSKFASFSASLDSSSLILADIHVAKTCEAWFHKTFFSTPLDRRQYFSLFIMISFLLTTIADVAFLIKKLNK